MSESASILRYLANYHHAELGHMYGLMPNQDPSYVIRQQIDELLDFNGTVMRPAYMGALGPMLVRRFTN